MSVDTKLIIGRLDESPSFPSDEGCRWLSVVATVDLRSLGSDSLIHAFELERDNYPRAFFYADDGDTKIFKDKYDLQLFAIPMDEFVKVFRKECKRWEEKEGELYRRYAWALPLLTRMKNYQPIENLNVILYFH